MDQKNKDEIVERLKDEGQLIRNTGTNSLKSIRTDLKKFDAVFQSIDESLIRQTQILRASLQIQTDEARRNETINELMKAERTQSQTSNDATGSSQSINFSEEQKAGGFLTSLFALFGIGAGGGAIGAAGASLLAALKKPLRLALFSVIAPAIGNIVGITTETALQEFGVDKSAAAKFGEAANLGSLWGLKGLAFGKRAGLMGAAGGAAYSFGDELLDAVGLDKEKMISIFGQEMKLETLASSVLGSLGVVMGGVLSSPAVWKSVSDLVKNNKSLIASKNNKSLIASKNTLAMVGATAVMGLYLKYGDETKEWLSQQGMPKDFVNTTVDVAGSVASGVSLGMMFGPKGALVGAALGFAIGLGKSIVDWVIGVRDDATKEFNSQLEKSKDIIEKATSGEILTEEERNQLLALKAEAERRTRLMLPGEEPEKAASVVKMTEAALSKQPLEAERGISQLEINERVSSALEGNKDSLNELVEYLKDRGLDDDKIASTLVDMGERYFYSLTKEGKTQRDINDMINKWEDIIYDKENSFKTGTPGFLDFGKGSFAVLHGREAVVPETTPAGQFLKNYFDENWQPNVSKIAEASTAAVNTIGGTSIFNYAPTNISPTNNTSIRGGSSQTSINNIGGNSRNDLDMMSKPNSVH